MSQLLHTMRKTVPRLAADWHLKIVKNRHTVCANFNMWKPKEPVKSRKIPVVAVSCLARDFRGRGQDNKRSAPTASRTLIFAGLFGGLLSFNSDDYKQEGLTQGEEKIIHSIKLAKLSQQVLQFSFGGI